MNRMLVRFGLPWLIFGSAIYALYWTVLHGESAVSITPTEGPPKHSSHTQRAGRSDTILISPIHHAGFQTRSQPNSGTAVKSTGVPVTAAEQHPLAPVPRRVDAPDKSTAEQDSQGIASDIHVALQDPDPTSRYRALQESGARGVIVPAHILQQMATSDRDAPVRILAMTMFAQDPEVDLAMVKAVAEAGLRDSDVTVNAHARDMLEQLDRASRSNDEAPQLLPGDPTVE